MSEGKLNISSHFNEHTYPWILEQYPQLICFIYFWNGLLLQRNKVVKKELSRKLKRLSKGIVVDAGSGEGMFILPYANQFPNTKFIGIDKNKNHIDFCKNYVEKCKLKNASFFCQNLEKEPEINNADLLLCVGTLQYVENDSTAITNFYKILKKNGQAIIYAPINGRTILPIYRHYFSQKKHYEISQDRKRIYSESDMIKKLKNAGLEIVDKKYTYGKLGIFAHEIYSLSLLGIANGKWTMMIFVIILIFFLPLILLLILFDYNLPKNNGNGLLIIAKK